MEKKQRSNELDLLDKLKKTIQDQDEIENDGVYDDAGTDEDDFDSYLADLIGKQTADLDMDVFADLSEDEEEPYVSDPKKTEEIIEEVTINVEELSEEPIEEIVASLAENEFSEELEEEIDEAAQEAVYLAYLASLESQESVDRDEPKSEIFEESTEQVTEYIEEAEKFEQSAEQAVGSIEEVVEEVSQEAIDEDFYVMMETIAEEPIEETVEEPDDETYEEADLDQITIEIPEHVAIQIPEPSVEPEEAIRQSEEITEESFIDCADEEEEEIELPIYSVERQKQLKQSRVATDSAVELGDRDVERLIELGYERETVEQIGFERYEKIRRRIASKAFNKCDVTGAFVSKGEEFNSKTQIRKIAEKYTKERRSLVIRLVASAFVALLMLIFNEPALFGVKSFWGISYESKPWVCSLVGLQLMIIVILISYKFMYNCIVKLLRLEPDKYSPIVLSILAICVYDVVISFSDSNTIAPQYNFMGAMLLIYALIGDFIRYRREILAFRIAASGKEKHSLLRVRAKKEKYKSNGKVQRIINDSKDERIYKVKKMILPFGFFKRVNSDSTNHSQMNFVLALTLLLSSIMLALSLILGGSVQKGMSAFMLTTLACMPISTLIYRLYPFFSVSEKIGKYGCTILGEGDVEEYSGRKTLIFDDKGLFFGRANTEILFKSSGDITTYIKYSKYVFDAIGGTLANIIEDPTDSVDAAPEIEFTEISETGVVAIMGGDMSVVVGDTYYLKQHGILIPRDCEEKTISQKRESSIIYLAFDGKVKLGYELEYKTTKPFELLLRRLEANNTAVAIYTKDPNINLPFLNRSRSENAVHIDVIKENSLMSGDEPENIDCGLIAVGSEGKITIPIIACEQLRKLWAFTLKIRVAIYVFSLLCVTLLCVFGVTSVINSLFIILYQALCTVPIFIATSKKIKYEEFTNGTKAKRDTQVGKQAR